jgi:hypothetical protein
LRAEALGVAVVLGLHARPQRGVHRVAFGDAGYAKDARDVAGATASADSLASGPPCGDLGPLARGLR